MKFGVLRANIILTHTPWCCLAEEDVEAEQYFRRLTVQTFVEVLRGYDAVAREYRAMLTYLVGDLWHWVGDLGMAGVWFERVAGEVADERGQEWIVEVLHRQRDEPRERFW